VVREFQCVENSWSCVRRKKTEWPEENFHRAGGETVGAEVRIETSAPRNALRLLRDSRAKALWDNCDIEQSSAAPFGVVANVGGIAIEIAEDGECGFELANFSAADQFFYAKPLRVRFNHEGFTIFYVGAITDAHQCEQPPPR